MRIGIFKGQIAVFLVLLMALIFLFVVITMNIGQFSQEKTVVSQAADGAVLLHASLRSSYGRACWSQIRQVCTDASPVQEHKPGDKWDHCNVDWKAVFIIPVAAIIAQFVPQLYAYIIMAVAWASLALKALAIDPMSLRAQNRILQSFIKSLPSNLQMVENAIGYALSLVVDDPNQVEDIHDINQNGNTTDKVLAFARWRAENLAALIGGNEGPKLDLRDKIKAVLPAFENFRRYLAGPALKYTASAITNPNDWWKEDYLEFALNPEWKTKYDLEACTAKCCNTVTDCGYNSAECANNCQKQIDRLTPEVKSLLLRSVNPYYPQDYYPTTPPDYGFMRLLADFEAVKLPRETFESTQEKLPFKIQNVNLQDFLEYPEEIKYNFLFWKVGVGNVGEGQQCQLGRSADLLDSYPVAYYWVGAPFEPVLCPDNVDFVRELLEKFRFFAYGGHEEMWDWSQKKWTADGRTLPDDKLCSYYQDLRWQPGVASYTPFEAQRNFSSWVRTLVNLDDYKPPEPLQPGQEPTQEQIDQKARDAVEHYRDTSMAEVELLLEMIGPPYGQWVDGYGWWGELQRVKATKPFFADVSDVPKTDEYRREPNPACSGVPSDPTSCGAIGKYVGLNGKRQELKDKMDKICEKIGAIDTDGKWGWNFSCSDCYSVACVNGLRAQIGENMRLLGLAIQALQTQIAGIQAQIAADEKTIADIKKCQDGCGSCDEGDTTCEEALDECLSGCPTGDISALQKEIDDLNAELGPLQDELQLKNDEMAALTVVSTLADKMLVLARSLEYVEQLIGRINTAQARIKNFWNMANAFYVDIMQQSYLEQLWDVDNGKAPDQPEVQVIYSWKTKNVLAKDVLDPDHPPIRHYVRVTASNPPMPVLKAKRCYGIFGKGAEILHPEDDVWVKVERFDEDKALSLGGKGVNWLNWLYHTSHPPKDQRSLADIKAQNLDEYESIVESDIDIRSQHDWWGPWDPNRLFSYAVSSYAKAHYTPRIYRIMDKSGNRVAPVRETYITQTK